MDALILFTNMTDDDLIEVHKEGQLKNLCLALSLDLQNYQNKTDKHPEC